MGQETIPIIITVTKARPSIRNVMDMNVLIRRIKEKYLFGFDYFKQRNVYLPYFDIEKTFIDMIYFEENLNEESLKNTLDHLNKTKLDSYLKRYPKTMEKKVRSIADQC